MTAKIKLISQGGDGLPQFNHNNALPPAAGEIMLITCWPFGAIDPGTTKRYLVLAQKL